MATQVAPLYHPSTQEMMQALGFVIETGSCDKCGSSVIVQIVRDGEPFQDLDPAIDYICPPCARLTQDFT